ncbi:TetR/AcrR family transcriptional regulator [Nocardia spumae]|uniref:TetR/AcrR family transcriptional regulator n=1 Tax=Nocardia spumae TaxID=2887190 RepID=UPI001D1522ED|nr:TetR/AcrR family transcriptional regulator [Nocardia spumae]
MNPPKNSRGAAAGGDAALRGEPADTALEALPPGLAAAWGVLDTGGQRGPKPAHTVEEIVTVAMRLADDEGIAATSLSKVAGRVGVTTNALYRYVSSKDELITLVADHAWGDPPAVQDVDWREGAALWSRQLFRRFLSRPWLLDVPTTIPLTPRNAAWLDTLITVLKPTGMGTQQMLNCAYLLDSHARYGANLQRNTPTPAALRRANPGQQRVIRAIHLFLDEQLRARNLNAVAEVLEDPAYLTDEPPLDGFEFGLARILDGIEAYVLQCRLTDEDRGAAQDRHADRGDDVHEGGSHDTAYGGL